MPVEDRTPERWQVNKPPTRTRGYYEHKNVRFIVAPKTGTNGGWTFQPFGRQPLQFGTWEEVLAAVESTCTAIAQHRTERRSR
jgi:hypothetical protein